MKKILKYYLSSEPHFLIFVDFLLTKGFYKTFSKNEVEYEELSDVVVKISEHTQIHNGFYLSSENAYKYFEQGYSDIQLFSIIFALILNRSEEEVSLLADKNYSGISFYILHSILSGMDLLEIRELINSCENDISKTINSREVLYQGKSYYRLKPIDKGYSYPWRSYFDKSSLFEAEI